MLGDLGADVVRVVPPAGDPLAGNVARAWNAGKQVVALAADDPALDALLADADVVFDELGRAGHAPARSGARAAGGVGAHLRRSAATGPRSGWRASDLGVMAATGNMYCTGDPDRAPIRSHRAHRATRTPGPRPRSRR